MFIKSEDNKTNNEQEQTQIKLQTGVWRCSVGQVPLEQNVGVQ